MAFNWDFLRNTAHLIANTVRNVQVTAREVHRDFDTIREMNREYASEHRGSAPHWDNYDSDGYRTNGRNRRPNSGNGNRRSDRERQRQRDRSFERQHPFLSRTLFYAMPHLGGYETGRGVTWNVRGERWGDSFRRGSEYITNFMNRQAQARAYRAGVGGGTGTHPLPTPVPVPQPSPTTSHANRSSRSAPAPNNPFAPNPSSTTPPVPVPQPSPTHTSSSEPTPTAQNRNDENRPHNPSDNSQTSTNDNNRVNNYVLLFDGTFEEMVQRQHEKKERWNREIEEKMHSRLRRSQDSINDSRRRELDDYIKRLHKHDWDITSKYLEFQRETRELMQNPAMRPKDRAALAAQASKIHAKFSIYKKNKSDDIDSSSALNDELTNMLNDKIPTYQQFADIMRDRYNDYIDEVDLATNLYGVNDVPRLSLEEYAKWRTTEDFDEADKKFNPLVMQKLLDDLRKGEKTTYTETLKKHEEEREYYAKQRAEIEHWRKYELPEQFAYHQSYADELRIKQKFGDLTSAMDFVKSEGNYIDDDETKAHDINISQTSDGKYNVESEIPQSTLLDNDGNDIKSNETTVADIIRMHYHGDDIVISIGNNRIPLESFENMNVAIAGDNQIAPIVTNQNALINSIFDNADDTDSISTAFAATPSSTIRSAAPSVATRSNAETIKNSMNSGSEEEVWVSEHIRAGHFVNHYSRSRPHRS